MLFCNRTNRSGILTAGVIGGLKQDGKYKLDCRFNKEKLIKMIEELSLYKGRVEVHNKDAVELLTSGEYDFKDALIFLDPPYFDKGRRLYVKSYTTDCHVGLAKVLKGSLQSAKWVLTYDNVPDISKLYEGVDSLEFCLHYSANKRVVGTEVMYFSNNLVKGKYEDYLKLPNK
jgi:DNA-methyltransferase